MEFASLFADPSGWQVFASGQAEGKLTPITALDGKPGVRMDYDFHGGGGFVVMRRIIALTLPDTFEIGFILRGDGPPNHFEFKVAAPGGANVWRHLRQDYRMPLEWKEFHFHEREFPFAWGPAGGGAPSEVEAVEIVIAAGTGGRGSVELSNAKLEDQTLGNPHAVTATSHLINHPPQAACAPGTLGWKSAADDMAPCWAIDFGRSLRFGGLVIHWPDGLPPRECALEVSQDGKNWTVLRRLSRALGGKSHISTPQADARHLRVVFKRPECAAILRIELKPDAFSSTPNEFIHSVAAEYPRGWHPRYWHREQSYWTPVGSPDGRRRALINEEGMIEVDEGGFSLEPFILTDSGMLGWADVESTCKMAKQGLPIPSVIWKRPGLRLEILPWMDGKDGRQILRVTYRLRITRAHSGMRLAIAIRPFQVNPPWQAFRNLGGRSSITQIMTGQDGVQVNDRLVFSSPPPAQTGAAMFEEGGVMEFMSKGQIPSSTHVDDDTGIASGVMCWALAPGTETLEVTVSVPYFKAHDEPKLRSRSNALARWKRKLTAVEWQVPECAKDAFECMCSAAGHILINRDGPAIQPGPRRYTRSWVRDCVIMGAALAKVGVPHALDVFIRWYAQFQREDGFVPCVVDRDGVDWLVEHDSHGQFLWGIREVFRECRDPRFLTIMMPHARKAADYLIILRASRMTDDFRHGERAKYFGLLPESASHEGYLAHPVHSYWDDYWGVRGLEAAADLAEAEGLPDDSKRWRDEAVHFQNDLLASLEMVIEQKNLNYIPGSVEWADFDPTATSNAIAMLDFADVMPARPLHAMLETYLDGHRRKHRGEMQWNNYTAYEIRIIGAFVRLGQRDIANELLEFHLSDRRPREWNQWPEITWRDPRSPGHLGDVPHTWIAAEYILVINSMIADEREASSSLVLASGVPWKWIAEEDGISVRQMPTRYGPLDFHIRAKGQDSIHVRIADTIRIPPGGLRIIPPLPEGKRLLSIHSMSGEFVLKGNELHIHVLPCHVELLLGT